LYGKVTILKSFALSQLTYVATVVPSPIHQRVQEDFFKKVETILYNFLWGGPHRDKIKRNTVIGLYEDGGLKMIHVRSQNQALKLSWIKRLLCNQRGGKWKDLVSYQLPCFQDIWKCNIRIKDYDNIFKFVKSTFWKEVTKLWCMVNFFEPKNAKDIVS
jgi:hypothetical protein